MRPHALLPLDMNIKEGLREGRGIGYCNHVGEAGKDTGSLVMERLGNTEHRRRDMTPLQLNNVFDGVRQIPKDVRCASVITELRG